MKKKERKEINIQLIPIYIPDAEFQEKKNRDTKPNCKNGSERSQKRTLRGNKEFRCSISSCS